MARCRMYLVVVVVDGVVAGLIEEGMVVSNASVVSDSINFLISFFTSLPKTPKKIDSPARPFCGSE